METIKEESLTPQYEDPQDDDAAAEAEADPAVQNAGSGGAPSSSEGKIFVGGLPRETTEDEFRKHFASYGRITDSVIMKDRNTRYPRGFGFITYADATVVDKVILESHVFGGKTVEIKRTIPKGAVGTKDFKTKKLFVGGIPGNVTDDELKEFFEKFGEVKEHMIMRDHTTSRSRGFGFVTFATEEAVDELLTKGNKVDFAGAQVEIKKAEPKSSSTLPPRQFRDSRAGFGRGYRDVLEAASYGADPYMAGGGFAGGGFGGRAYGGFVGSQYNAGYGGGYGGYGLYRGYSGYGGDYDMGGFDQPIGGYGYSTYDASLGAGYGSSSGAAGLYGSRRASGGNVNGNPRFHPYSSLCLDVKSVNP